MRMQEGCVQPAPSTNSHAAAARVIDRRGISTLNAARASVAGRPVIEAILQRLGFDPAAVPGAHLCRGSAATRSITQPELAQRRRNTRLDVLESGKPEPIVTANIGCQPPLDGAARITLRHWIEFVEASLP